MAALFADKVRSELRTVRWLTSGATPEAILGEVAEYRNLESIMLVGHEPDLSNFAAYLIGAPSGDSFRVRKASLSQFTVTEFRAGGGRVEFSIPVKLL